MGLSSVSELLGTVGSKESPLPGAVAARSVLAIFPDPFPVTRVELEQTMRLRAPRTRLSSRDALHAAVCLTNGLEGIVSAERAFDRVPGVTRFDPLKLVGP